MFWKSSKPKTQPEPPKEEFQQSPFSYGQQGLGTTTRRPRQRTTELRILTAEEERDRSFRAAREHYVARVNQVEETHAFADFVKNVWAQFIAYAQLFIVCYALYWLYHNQTTVMDWWDGLLRLTRENFL
jgi:hypothetical protein